MKTTLFLTPNFHNNANPINCTKLGPGHFQKRQNYSFNIAEKIWLPVKYLKLMGYLITSKHGKNPIDNENIFYCKIFSLDGLWAMSLQIFLLCGFYKTTEALKTANNWVVSTLLLIGFLQASIPLLTAWFRYKCTTNMLNGWNKIENQFIRTFHFPLILPKLGITLRNIYLIHFISPLTTIVGLTLVGVITSIEFLDDKEVLSIISTLITTIIMTLGMLGMQTLVYLICQTMSCVYEEIHDNISVQAENLCSKTIYSWKTMLFTMQNQIREIGDWLSPNEAIYAVVKVINISTSLYTLLAVFSDPSKIKTSGSSEIEKNSQSAEFLSDEEILLSHESLLSNNTETVTGNSMWTGGAVLHELTSQMLLGISGITVSVSMLQLTLLVFYAEKISKSRRKIMTTLTELDTTDFKCEVKLELKSLIDTFDRVPGKLMCYNVVSLDRKLILLVSVLPTNKTFNATITYLIVLFQFKPL